MEENETIPTTSQEKTTVPDVNVEEEAKMQNVATSRMRFRIHLGLFILINLIIWVLYFTLFNAIVFNKLRQQKLSQIRRGECTGHLSPLANGDSTGLLRNDDGDGIGQFCGSEGRAVTQTNLLREVFIFGDG